MARNDHFCVICGKTGLKDRAQSCGLGICQAILLLNPERRDPTRDRERTRTNSYGTDRIGSKPQKMRTSKRDHDHIRAMLKACNFEAADWSLRGEVIHKDRRGTPAARDTIWGFLTRRKVLLKSISKGYERPAMEIARPAGTSVHDYIIKEWGGGSVKGMENAEIFYAWRCTCPAQSQIIYETLQDIPLEDGYHGSCGHCGCAALEITTK